MAIDLHKCIIDLSKKAAFVTNQHGSEGRCAQVILVLDISASMNRLSGELSMFLLRIAEDWASKMSRIRDAHTDDTHLIRFDNTYYRLCRPGPETFQVKVTPGTGRVDEGITLTLQVCDLYVTHIGNRLFGRYASTVDRLTPQALTLDQAVLNYRRPKATACSNCNPCWCSAWPNRCATI